MNRTHRALLAAMLPVATLLPAAAQLRTDNDQRFDLDTPGLVGTPESGANLGTAVVGGDFDGDGFADLAIAAPLEDLPGSPFGILDVGAVYVLGGSAGGLSPLAATVRLQSADLRAGGRSLASADFDLDGFHDLVVGGPEVTVGGAAAAGRIAIYDGSIAGLGDPPLARASSNEGQPGDRFGSVLLAFPHGLDAYPSLWAGLPEADVGLATGDDRGRWEIYTADAAGLGATADSTLFEPFASAATDVAYGAAAAAGDFDGDGWVDLAVAAPDWDDDTPGPCSPCDAGRIHVLRNGTGTLLHWLDFDIGDLVMTVGSSSPDDDDHFGTALAAGDLNGDGFDDLAIGVPDNDLGSFLDDGNVYIVFGSPAGLVLDGTPAPVWRRDSAGESTAQHMGAALAIADFNGDTVADLAVGVPGDVVGGVAGGSVLVYFGPTWSPGGAWHQRLAQGEGGVGGTNEANDRFGAALAVADFDGDCRADLAVGVPGEDVRPGLVDEGAFQVFYGPAFPFANGFEEGDLHCWSGAAGAD